MNNNKNSSLIVIMLILMISILALLSVKAARGQEENPGFTEAVIGNSFTHQGRIDRNGAPHNGLCDFRFGLWDAEVGGNPVPNNPFFPKPNPLNVPVQSGIYTVALNFGSGIYDGTALWIETEVRCAGEVDYTLLPRQALRGIPYALGLVPGVRVGPYANPGFQAATSAANTGLGNPIGIVGLAFNGNPTGFTPPAEKSGVFGYAESGHGVYGSALNGTGITGSSNITGVEGFGLYSGVKGESTNGYGVYGTGLTAGVKGLNSGGGFGVQGESNNIGVYGTGDTTGVYGVGETGVFGGGIWGVYGKSSSPGYAGVLGDFSNSNIAIAGIGVLGETDNLNSIGVKGVVQSAGSIGVWGMSTTTGTGVYGTSPSGVGVWGVSSNNFAGYFDGPVQVTGLLYKGGGGFRIDHPLDPANKYLNHSFVESPDMKNLYDGVVTLDESGVAWIDLPEWFEALNQDFRYQLTPIGASMPNLYVAAPILDNRFQIAGGVPGLQVSWQVTGTRIDPYAQANRIPIEEAKPGLQQGTYLHPELYGQPESAGLSALLSQGAPTEFANYQPNIPEIGEQMLPGEQITNPTTSPIQER